MSYTQFKDGYAIESTFKSNSPQLDGAGDQAYILGVIDETSEHPSPTWTINKTATGVNVKEVAAGCIWKSQEDMRGVYYLIIQNGIPIWLAMGASSTAGAGPYTHTITPTTDGSLLPSITVQHEEKGDATNEEYQFTGVKVDSITLSQEIKEGGPLLAQLEIMAASAADPGFAMTNDPILPPTANSASYRSLTRTWDYGGTPLSIDGLTKIEIVIANGLYPVNAHSWDTGVYTGDEPYEFGEANTKEYQINLTLHKNTIERAIWDELITKSNTKEVLFKWTRSTNDYIQVIATDCQVKSHPIHTPKPGETDLVTVVLVPRALSFEVKDSINGSPYYGE